MFASSLRIDKLFCTTFGMLTMWEHEEILERQKHKKFSSVQAPVRVGSVHQKLHMIQEGLQEQICLF
jgi:hypothetical protein